jgi:hypothetical protein
VAEHPDERERRRRLQVNEYLFRALNERIDDRISEMRDADHVPEDPDEPVRYLCECSDAGCRERYDLAPEDFRRVHAHPDDCVVLAGHERLDLEFVIDQPAPGLLLVRKRPL